MSSSVFDLFPQAHSVALAGIRGIPASIRDHVLNEYLRIVEAREDLDRAYLPRLGHLGQESRVFSHYIIGVADDARYADSFRQITSPEDAKSSITIAHQALCIYFGKRFDIGPILGLARDGGPAAYVLALPGRAERNTELNLWAWQPRATPFGAWPFGELALDEGFSEFLDKVARVYSEERNKSWIVAATAYTAGVTAGTAFESILNLAVAMEALLNMGEREQMRFRLSLYMALLVGRNLTERREIEKGVRKFYDLRSGLVHGGFISLTDDQFVLITMVGHWLSVALRKTCGMTDSEVREELEYRKLLGAPRHSQRRNVRVYRQEHIASFIAAQERIEVPWRSRFSLSEPDADGIRELLVQFVTDSETFGPYSVSEYVVRLVWHDLPRSISQWTDEVAEDGEEYAVLVSYETDAFEDDG